MVNNQEELKQTANQLAARGKGLLAVDESTPTIGKRLAGINVENNEENRQAYRGMLFTTEGLGKYISGAILFEGDTLSKALRRRDNGFENKQVGNYSWNQGR